MPNKAIFIVGPTGVGKTKLAFDIASKFNGSLISADSVQVYKGLDIISGKDLPQDYSYHAGYYSSNSGSSINLLDVVEPTIPFNVSEFQKLAKKSIDALFEKNKLPIVVGGTGLYIKSLTTGFDETTEPDLKLRKKLEGMSVSDLQKMLPSEKIQSSNDSDKANPRRLIRAIEISNYKQQATNYPEGASFAYHLKPKFDSLVIGLKCDREILKKKINDRVEERIKNGALREATVLFKNYERLAPQVKDANGYKQLFAFLSGKLSMDEAVERWKVSEYRHAKNQMTWFEKYGQCLWFDIQDKDHLGKINTSLSKFLV